MTNLFRAEWLKISGNRIVVASLIWIFPAGATGILILMTLIALFGTPETRQNMGIASVNGGVEWTGMALSAWGVPNDVFLGRFLLAAFTAVIFAGEYQWGTWKNVLPRRRRVPLVLAKFAALGVFIVLAFSIMSVILAVGMGIPVAIAGGTYGPAPSGEVLTEFAGDYLLQAGTAFVSVMIAASYAALAAMVTRSILGSVIIGIGAVFVEISSYAAFGLLAMLLNKPEIISLYQFTPTFCISNVVSWINTGSAFTFGTSALAQYGQAGSLGHSVFILAVWVVALVGLTVYRFRKQDVIS